MAASLSKSEKESEKEINAGCILDAEETDNDVGGGTFCDAKETEYLSPPSATKSVSSPQTVLEMEDVLHRMEEIHQHNKATILPMVMDYLHSYKDLQCSLSPQQYLSEHRRQEVRDRNLVGVIDSTASRTGTNRPVSELFMISEEAKESSPGDSATTQDETSKIQDSPVEPSVLRNDLGITGLAVEEEIAQLAVDIDQLAATTQDETSKIQNSPVETSALTAVSHLQGLLDTTTAPQSAKCSSAANKMPTKTTSEERELGSRGLAIDEEIAKLKVDIGQLATGLLDNKKSRVSDHPVCRGEHRRTHLKEKICTLCFNPVDQSVKDGSKTKPHTFPEDEKRQWKFINGVFHHLRRACPIFGILVVGETGSGKSTLINNLLGKEVARVGHTMESETSFVTPHELSVEGVPIVVYDTPGLDDSRGSRSEKKHLEIMKTLLARGKIHLVIYCLKMTETRMRRGLIRTFREYHKIGVPWEQTVITLTFADNIKETTPRFYQMQQQVKKTLIESVGVSPSYTERLKICPTAIDSNEALPNGRLWYIPFWLDVVEVLVPAALARFLDIHKGNIQVENMPVSSKPPSRKHTLVNIGLAGKDKERLEEEVIRLVGTTNKD